MRSDSSENGSRPDATATVELPLPVRETDLFKHAASPSVLNFLGDNPDVDVSIRQLSRVTPVTERATREAVDALEGNDLVETFHEGNARRVRINRRRLQRPEDPVETVPQVPFRTPVRVAKRYVEDELDDVLGIVLFGSTARGEADRQSDIDLWILVADDLLEQRHRANRLAEKLEGLQIPPTVALDEARGADFASNWPAIRDRLENGDRDWATAERHSFELVVETPQSILGQSTRVDPEKLFGAGITLRSSETLDRVVEEVLRSE